MPMYQVIIAASCSGIPANALVAMRASRGVYVPSTIPKRRSSGTDTRPRPDCWYTDRSIVTVPNKVS